MVGFVWCMAMGDKWSGTSLSMAYILDQILELGNFPENLTFKSNERKCGTSVQWLVGQRLDAKSNLCPTPVQSPSNDCPKTGHVES